MQVSFKPKLSPLDLGAALLCFCFALFVSPALLSLFHMPAGIHSLPLALAITVLISKLSKVKLSAIVVVAISLISFLVAGLLSLLVIDQAADSQMPYEMISRGIGRVWNPFWRDQYPGYEHDLALHSYPKAVFWMESVFFSVFHSFKAVKAAPYVLWFASFLLSLGVLKDLFQKRTKWILVPLAFLVSANPVFLMQSTTGYVDGAHGILLLCAALGLLIVVRHPSQRKGYVVFMIAAILAINTKLTAALFLGVFGMSALLWLVLERSWVTAKKLLLCGTLSAVLSIGVFGFHPYVTNILNYGHPFPVLRDQIQSPANLFSRDRDHKYRDIMSQWRDQAFSDHGKVASFFLAYFTGSRNPRNLTKTTNIQCKAAFQVSQSELISYTVPDATLGGFGPYYGLLFLMVSVLLLFGASEGTKRNKKTTLWIFATVFLSVLACPEMWWARFVPHAWLLPCVLLCGGLSLKRGKVSSAAILICLITGFANIGLIFIPNLLNRIDQSRKVQTQYDELRMLAENATIQLFHSEISNIRGRFQDEKIPYVLGTYATNIVPHPQDLIKCAHPIPLVGSFGSEVCVIDSETKKEMELNRHPVRQPEGIGPLLQRFLDLAMIQELEFTSFWNEPVALSRSSMSWCPAFFGAGPKTNSRLRDERKAAALLLEKQILDAQSK